MASVELQIPETLEAPKVLDRTADTEGVSNDTKNNTESKHRSRRQSSRFRKIPRSNVDMKETKSSRSSKGSRARTTSVSSVASGRSQRRGGKPSRRRTTSEASAVSEVGETSPLRKLRDAVMDKHQKKGLNLLNSYIKNRIELAKFENTTSFLERCDAYGIVPNKYRLVNPNLKNTKLVLRTLDRFSFQLMFLDLKYHRKRRFQVNKLLGEKENRMREMFSADLVEEIMQVAQESFSKRSNRIREQQAKIFDALLKEFEITDAEKAECEQRLKRAAEREKVRQERRALEREQKGGETTKHSEKAAGDSDSASENATGAGAASEESVDEGDEQISSSKKVVSDQATPAIQAAPGADSGRKSEKSTSEE